MPSKPPLRRLLHSFPVKALRSEWQAKGQTKDDVINYVISKVDVQNIADFIERSIGLTKQHIYLFEHDLRQLAHLPKSVLASYEPDKVLKNASSWEYFYLLPLEFHYVAGSPPDEGTISFPWPAKIVFRRRIAEVHLTTMEKDLEAYLEGEKPVYSVRRDLDDKDVLEDLHKALADITILSRLDINAGVKYLWGQDIIDALRAAWKSPVSTKINAMDGEYMIKRDDKPEYDRAILSPLLKTIFKVLTPNLNWPEVMLIDATNGEVSIPRYSKDVKAIENALGEILRHN